MIYLVGIGAALGSLFRYEFTVAIKKRFIYNWPLATFIINLVGSFLLGLLFGVDLPANYYLFLGTGILGGFTTFSTLNTEIIGLFNNKKIRIGIIYMFLSYLSGFFLLAIGYFLGHMM
ncbi:CrcB family protein [Ligilactobacillus sp. WILCCON 0076]|uniref:Fluoride-specific ion channel FluC n=1 Tax=Ligilactobacillus ubinensis TaxID=2876789 RepID=A0A9X2FS50_9LACO|nr:CrcB family protein [Ligilactobacillus ubinensis]MCP0887978.1 CrcB family protein [Ligilactobacillus ubinensis]